MIRGFFNPAILPQPILRVAVRIPAIHPDWQLVNFIVDTGAAVTCIHAIDAMRLFGMSPASLAPTALPNPSPIGGIGGGLTYGKTPAEYGFLRDGDQWHVLSGEIRIGELRSQGTPALLGWDLLKNFELTTHGKDQTITLRLLE